MTDKDNGGPAFPIETTATPWAEGMTLRDWFAGQALAGMLAHGIGPSGPADVAWAAYQAADAMLEARK